MLKSHTPFPLVGSYALFEQDGETHLVRIVLRDLGGTATIAFPFRDGASGNARVEIEALRCGEPLTASEINEAARLQRKRKSASDKARLKRLRTREIDARIMAEKLADLRVFERRVA
jgi:hypothetical protein